ncbi:excalibur calcium-binding domain-containing protein [Mycobacterium sp. 23]|uniref:excalibur calcium-binding domain-containing protein n=1 Tax=Mycobacterium sp. 23 TaxID=3400424 RepID=UPI003AABA5C2
MTESPAGPEGRFQPTPEQRRIIIAVVVVIIAVVLTLMGVKLDSAERTGPPPRSPVLTSDPATTNLPHHYKNCSEAWADGKTNIPRGDPDYHPALDRDGNGWACEKGRG